MWHNYIIVSYRLQAGRLGGPRGACFAPAGEPYPGPEVHGFTAPIGNLRGLWEAGQDKRFRLDSDTLRCVRRVGHSLEGVERAPRERADGGGSY